MFGGIVLNRTSNDEIEIDLLQFFRAYWKNAVYILLAAILFGAAAFGATGAFITPKYEAFAKFYVNNSSFSVGGASFSISSGELSAAQTLVNTYVEILKSRPTLEKVIERSSVTYTVEELERMITTEDIKSTGIFKVTVESTNPLEAELLANTITKILPDRISEIVDGSSVRIVQSAIVPAKRCSPNLLKNTAIGAFLGILLVTGIITVKVITSPGEEEFIISSDDLAALCPDLPVLTVVPNMRKSGKKGYYSSYYGGSGKEKKNA